MPGRPRLTVRNRSDQAQSVVYGMQGPVGVRLENEEHTRKFREIKVGFLDETRIRQTTMRAGEVHDEFGALKEAAEDEDDPLTDDDANSKMEAWKRPFKYIGLDVQYFAVLLTPLDDRSRAEQETTPWTATT